MVLEVSIPSVFSDIFGLFPSFRDPNWAQYAIKEVVILVFRIQRIPSVRASSLVNFDKIIVISIFINFQSELRMELVYSHEGVLTDISELNVVFHDVHSEEKSFK